MDAARKIIDAIRDRRQYGADTRESEARIAGLREALTLAVGPEEAHRMAVAAGEAE